MSQNPIGPPFDGFVQVLISAGIAAAIARAIGLALQEDENIVDIVQENKTPIVFMTQQDSKVDDKICLPLQGTVYDLESPQRPKIPSDTHPNCRCFYVNAITGQNLGQI